MVIDMGSRNNDVGTLGLQGGKEPITSDEQGEADADSAPAAAVAIVSADLDPTCMDAVANGPDVAAPAGDDLAPSEAASLSNVPGAFAVFPYGALYARERQLEDENAAAAVAAAETNEAVVAPAVHEVEAYAVLNDEEDVIDELQEQLGVATQQLKEARSQLSAPVVEGVPLPPDLPYEGDSRTKRKRVVIGASLLLVSAAVLAGVSIYFIQSGKDSTKPPAAAAAALGAVKERGVLRCGVVPDGLGYSFINEETQVREGFEIDLCKAIAAALLGSSYRYETIGVTPANRFVTLASGAVDLIVASTTHTFERDVHQASAEMGFSFSSPYLYGGLTFGGVPEFVSCADELSAVGDCAGLLICVIPGTTWMDKIKALFPGSNIVAVEEQETTIVGLITGICNVIAGEQVDVPEVTVRYYGYDGPYAMGKNTFSKEPLAIVTRDGDPEFADFVNWVLQGLLHAEARNITMVTADSFAKTGHFGDQFENMFQDALAAVGNYEEIYARNLEYIMPRLKVNMINTGDTGLLYSRPFGQVNTIGPRPVKGGVIESIVERGFLRCGIALPDDQTFAQDLQAEVITGRRVGLDIEFCRALSASVLNGKTDKISFETFPESSGYNNISLALENGDIDVYAGGEVNMHGDVQHPGLSFSEPYFYEVSNGTVGKAFSLATSEDDAQWTDLVYWAIMATVFAEENGIIQTTSNEMPLVKLFGPDLERILRDVIIAVGNYGEMYGRVFDQNVTRVGPNLLNVLPFGPEHYPLPMGDHLADEY
mmetsp:Transcript_2880/g.6193  ORF Transcript_2880/g.6193 Transcript_2880/m.6193 type:complete len:768 (-) Transcript_2880:229-2532(-)